MISRRWAVWPLLALFLLSPPLSGQSDNLPMENITLAGNSTFPETQLRALMKLQASSLFRRQPFSRRALRIDAITLRTFYYSQGFLEAVVDDSFAVNKQGRVEVFLVIKEGARYILDEVSLSGNRIMTSDEIIAFLEVQRGNPFNPVALRLHMEALRNHYQDLGNLAVDLVQETEIDVDVDLLITIYEGPTYTIGRILITGLEKVPERYLRRELLFKGGDQFNRSLLVRSQQRIFESGLFGAVEIIPIIQPVAQNIADVEIQVRELERRSIDLTLGFLQKEPVGAGVPVPAVAVSGQWWHSRVLNSSVRTGITLETDLVLQEEITPNLLLAWDILSPWTFGLRVPTSIRIYSDYRLTPEFIWRTGIDLSFLSRRTRRNQFRGGFNWVFIRADDPAVSPEGALEWNVTGAYLHRGVDSLLEPRRGTILQIEPSLHQTFLEGNPFYLKVEADLRRYHPLFQRGVFAYRIKGGYLATIPEGRQLARFDRFELGGSTSLRGWREPNSFAREGGTITGLANAEIRWPLIWRLGMELFVDLGALYAYADDGSGSQAWLTGADAGGGLYVTTPLGPIRVDVAFPWQGDGFGDFSVQAAFLYLF